MSFALPWAFFFLPVALFVLIRRYREQEGRVIRFPSTAIAVQLRSSWRVRFRHLPLALRLFAATSLTLALARPQVERFIRTPEREGIAIELLVDVSSSMDLNMDSKSGASSRLFVAKEVIREFILGNGEDLEGRPNDLIRMITFARYADTVCPLTHGHDALVYFTDALTINDRPNEDGTAYGDAVALASARLSKLEDRLRGNQSFLSTIQSKVIILLTDGENNCGRMLPLQAAALAHEWGIRIYTISISETPRTASVKLEDGSRIQASPARTAAERVLEQMAKLTGGVYKKVHDRESLHEIYRKIDELETSKMSATYRRMPVDLFHWFALFALACLIADFLLETHWLRRNP